VAVVCGEGRGCPAYEERAEPAPIARGRFDFRTKTGKFLSGYFSSGFGGFFSSFFGSLFWFFGGACAAGAGLGSGFGAG